jgi:hypothetical protein
MRIFKYPHKPQMTAIRPLFAHELHDERARLSQGPVHRFGELLDPDIPRVAAGCYTIWDESGKFIYAGMAGRTLTAERIEAARGDPHSKVTGLRDRLAAHRSGRRSGDQFSVYVFDRFVLAALSRDEITAAAAGTRRLDDDVREFIHAHLSYRWAETHCGVDAFALETVLVTEGINGALPHLNPRLPEEA